MPKSTTNETSADTNFRLPAILILSTPLLTILWYMLNTDAIGTVLFGEKLYYCNVFACAVTRDRFLPVAAVLCLLFLVGIGLLITRSMKGGNNAKN